MRVIIFTQNEPFYLAENLDYFFKSLSRDINIVGVCLTSASPYGKKETFQKKILKILKVFGFKFFIYYSIKYLLKFFNKNKDVKYVLGKHKIKIINLKSSVNHDESIKQLSLYQPDLIVSILGNEIFKKEIISLPKKGIINLHSSLLPKYRGLMPSFWVLKNNEKFTGVSIFYVDEGIDSGPILMQKKIPIKNFSQQELICITKKIGMDLILLSLEKIRNNKEINLLANNDKNMTYYSFPKRKDVKEFLNSGNRFF